MDLWPSTLSVLLIAVVLTLPQLLTLIQGIIRRVRLVRYVDKIPGPFAFPLLGTVVTIMFAKRSDLFNVMDRRTRKYWPIMRTWKGTRADIHLSKAEHIETILNSTVHISKSSMYDFLLPWLGEGLLTSTGRKWHRNRKLITPTFHFKILETFLEVFVEKSNVLVEKLQKEVGNRNGFDVYPYITLCTLDIICETAMGTKINAQNNEHSDYVRAIYNISESMLLRLLRPWLYPTFIFRRSDLGKRFYKTLAILHDFTNKVIQERKKFISEQKLTEDEMLVSNNEYGVKKRLAFLDLLLEASQGGTVLTDEEIRSEVDTFMFEGHDTTSAGIAWVLFLLGNYPDVQEKVFKELDDIFEGSDRPCTMRDLGEMKYLERVIKESLRLYPSVPFIARRLTEDVKIGDHLIPAGCDVTIHIYHVHRNPEYFPNPDEFNPDNFLPDRVQGRHPYAYIPFSAGSRNCIGQKFAILEEKAILSAVLRRFKITALDKRQDMNFLIELILRPDNGIRVTLESRK